MEVNEKWEPVLDIDINKKLPEDWAKIYHIKPLEPLPNDRLWSEYEWAYKFFEINYVPVSYKKIEKTSEMELRATLLRRDLFMGADDKEKQILEKEYIETLWAKRMLRNI